MKDIKEMSNLSDKKNQGFLKSYDMFGHEIGLNFEGSSTNNTACGGGVSIII